MSGPLGFRQTEPDPDHSTLHCPCGCTFTWSGFDPDLAGWIEAHEGHMGEEVQITDVWHVSSVLLPGGATGDGQ